ncbi:MAG: redox-sensing transcriptional repressor Rex [Candidatus Omnitrophica bacterium]|nr:redox-sensing transcriptional repressor Rex [Candidatus Omnitrophota bacterium]
MEPKILSAVSRSTLKRLPLYLHVLEDLHRRGVVYVSCTTIARKFDFGPILVRKDLEVTGAAGKAKIGFRVAGLIDDIKKFLGWHNVQDAFLVGAGNLGKALLGYQDFDSYGLNIVAVFDNDPRKIGTRIFNKEVLALDKLAPLVKRMHINIGIVAVSSEGAQAVVDALVAAGIRAVWNFAPAPLEIPEGVILENARLTQSLAVLTNKLKSLLAGPEKE